MSDVAFHVPEMHCGACENSIRQALSGADGVQDVRFEMEHRRVHVRFDEGKTGAAALKERIEQAGFDVG